MKKSCDTRPQLEIKMMASLSGEGIKHFLLLMNLEVVNQVWGAALRQIQLQSPSPERGRNPGGADGDSSCSGPKGNHQPFTSRREGALRT